MRELERIVGNIGEAATGLEIVYWRTKDNSQMLLHGVTESGRTYTEFLQFIVSNLQSTLEALQALKDRRTEEASEALEKVSW